jgi:hypothetical protein
MAKAATETAGIGDEVQTTKRKVNRGARGPQPVYLFVKQDPSTGKLVVSKSFRDPRKMAAFFAQAAEEGSQFLVTTPE